jgi:hypothetical protein
LKHQAAHGLQTLDWRIGLDSMHRRTHTTRQPSRVVRTVHKQVHINEDAIRFVLQKWCVNRWFRGKLGTPLSHIADHTHDFAKKRRDCLTVAHGESPALKKRSTDCAKGFRADPTGFDHRAAMGIVRPISKK